MKKLVVMAGLLISTFCVSAQEFEVEQLLLNVEKLAQFKQILQDMKDGYEILVKGYNTIKDLSEGNFNLHQAFLDGLLQVSPTVQRYYRIEQVVSTSLELTQQCKGALDVFRSSNLLSEAERSYLLHVYNGIIRRATRALEDLATVITAGELRMSDDERITTIDRIYNNVNEQVVFVRSFTAQNKILLLQKAKEQKDVDILRGLLGE